MSALCSVTVLVGDVGDAYGGTIGGGVRVRTLNNFSLLVFVAGVLEVSLSLGLLTITTDIAEKNEVCFTYVIANVNNSVNVNYK